MIYLIPVYEKKGAQKEAGYVCQEGVRQHKARQ